MPLTQKLYSDPDGCTEQNIPDCMGLEHKDRGAGFMGNSVLRNAQEVIPQSLGTGSSKSDRTVRKLQKTLVLLCFCLEKVEMIQADLATFLERGCTLTLPNPRAWFLGGQGCPGRRLFTADLKNPWGTEVVQIQFPPEV